VVGLSDSQLSLVDTGFNASVLIPMHLAAAAGYNVWDPKIFVSVALGEREKAFLCDGVIEWFGKSVEVEMLVSTKTDRRKDGDPDLSIGTELLAKSQLEIDFLERTLFIREI
jgi:predicted aspartyl protease